MVSQRRGGRRLPGATRARLLAAAAAEFADRGFAGAKVHRIAARARVNKAMVYYHFTNKAALYREILRDVFGSTAEAVRGVPDAGGPAEGQLRAFVAAIAATAVARPHFPAIWLRELAEGGRHLNEAILVEMRAVMETLVAILDQGRRTGRFRTVHPLLTQMAIVGPLLLFSASTPVRTRLRGPWPFALDDVTRDSAITYVQEAALAVLTRPNSSASRRRTRSQRP